MLRRCIVPSRFAGAETDTVDSNRRTQQVKAGQISTLFSVLPHHIILSIVSPRCHQYYLTTLSSVLPHHIILSIVSPHCCQHCLTTLFSLLPDHIVLSIVSPHCSQHCLITLSPPLPQHVVLSIVSSCCPQYFLALFSQLLTALLSMLSYTYYCLDILLNAASLCCS